MHQRSLKVVVAVTACALGLVACTSSSKNAKSSKEVRKDAALVFTLAADPGTLDPSKTLIGAAQQINRFTYDTLGEQGTDGKLEPTVAESWQVTASSVSFKIR